MNFEYIDDFRVRAKVFGGWIVETILRNTNQEELSVAICFVPDPNHEWELNNTFEDFSFD